MCVLCRKVGKPGGVSRSSGLPLGRGVLKGSLTFSHVSPTASDELALSREERTHADSRSPCPGPGVLRALIHLPAVGRVAFPSSRWGNRSPEQLKVTQLVNSGPCITRWACQSSEPPVTALGSADGLRGLRELPKLYVKS